MNCQWVQQNLSAYIDNELSIDQKKLVDNHLSLCNQCKSEFDRLFMAWDALSLWEDKRPPLHLKKTILRAVKKEKTFNLLRVLLPIAAVFVIAVSLVLFYRTSNYYDQRVIVKEQRRSQPQIPPIESVKVDDNEIIKNLQLIEEKEFLESVEVLKTIDYLPLIEETIRNESSMGYYEA